MFLRALASPALSSGLNRAAHRLQQRLSGRSGLTAPPPAPRRCMPPSFYQAYSSLAVCAISTGEMLQVERLPALEDNYVWLLVEEGSGKVAVVDPSEFTVVDEALQQRGLDLDYIINTHHHWDHTGGNAKLKAKYSCEVVGADCDAKRIPGIDTRLKEGDEWAFGGLAMRVLETPGHTSGHVTYFFPEAKALFPGDTLFMLGCGRLFEGTPQQMHASLAKIKALPEDTMVYCAHEYTESNARFALTVNPNNKALVDRAAEIKTMREQGVPTVPGPLSQELATNPFLRADDEDIRLTMGLPDSATELDTFTAVRKAKDLF
mmetsp:Transcript_26711/g.69240  ORF Transcript_26711/g.69240 Transcript_26711/m.69240 type:complete len:319 (-) Transcript_26711:322-1278(-)